MVRYLVDVTPKMLVALFEAEYPGIKVTEPEARMILGYHSKSDYPLKLDVIHRKLVRYDSQGVDQPEDVDTLADVITFCADINYDLTEEEKVAAIPSEACMKNLRSDLRHLDRLIEFMGQ